MSRTRSCASGSRFSTSVIARASARLSPERTPAASVSRVQSRRAATAGTLRRCRRYRRARTREGVFKERILLRRADGDANRLRRAEACERAHDHPFAEQRVEQRPNILARVRVDEVRDGGPRERESRALERVRHALPLARHLLPPPPELFIVAE